MMTTPIASIEVPSVHEGGIFIVAEMAKREALHREFWRGEVRFLVTFV